MFGLKKREKGPEIVVFPVSDTPVSFARMLQLFALRAEGKPGFVSRISLEKLANGYVLTLQDVRFVGTSPIELEGYVAQWIESELARLQQARSL